MGVDVKYPGGYNGPALLGVTACGDARIVETLIQYGADVNIRSQRYYRPTALETAVRDNNVRTAKMLLNAGADVRAQSSHETMLACAAKRGYDRMVKMLIDAGADIDYRGKDEYSQTPLQDALTRGEMNTAEMLIKAGADVNATIINHMTWHTPLVLAAKTGSKRIIELLMKRGAIVRTMAFENIVRRMDEDHEFEEIADIMLKSDWEVNGLCVAVREAARIGPEKMVQFLIRKNARVSGLTDRESHEMHGETALMAADSNGHDSMVQLLLRAGADPNEGYISHCQIRRTALVAAICVAHENTHDAVKRSTTMVQALLDAGARVHDCGDAALQHAVRYWGKRSPYGPDLEPDTDSPIVQLLLANGAVVNGHCSRPHKCRCGRGCRYPRSGILGAAVEHQNFSIVKMLLDHGADIHGHGSYRIRPERCCTILETAVATIDPKMGRLLIENGADVDVADPFEALNWFGSSMTSRADMVIGMQS